MAVLAELYSCVTSIRPLSVAVWLYDHFREHVFIGEWNLKQKSALIQDETQLGILDRDSSGRRYRFLMATDRCDFSCSENLLHSSPVAPQGHQSTCNNWDFLRFPRHYPNNGLSCAVTLKSSRGVMNLLGGSKRPFVAMVTRKKIEHAAAVIYLYISREKFE